MRTQLGQCTAVLLYKTQRTFEPERCALAQPIDVQRRNDVATQYFQMICHDRSLPRMHFHKASPTPPRAFARPTPEPQREARGGPGTIPQNVPPDKLCKRPFPQPRAIIQSLQCDR